tara:strand:+ start:9857 stop:10033 length:177 start_codon:yes stop_codon:yes gene_type:complete
MIQGLVLKAVIKAVIQAVRKAPDKLIAKEHEKRIAALEELAHPQRDLICKCCKKKETK